MSASVAALLIASLTAGLSARPADAPTAVVSDDLVAGLTITQHVIIRIPAHGSERHEPVGPAEPPHKYREKGGPHCLPAKTMAGAAITTPDSVDFIQRGGERYRARLDHDCPALDYYSGFYLTPGQDGRICSGRDSIRTRSGGDCQIDKIKRLVPDKP